jgi:hypothetical protein
MWVPMMEWTVHTYNGIVGRMQNKQRQTTCPYMHTLYHTTLAQV